MALCPVHLVLCPITYPGDRDTRTPMSMLPMLSWQLCWTMTMQPRTRTRTGVRPGLELEANFYGTHTVPSLPSFDRLRSSDLLSSRSFHWNLLAIGPYLFGRSDVVQCFNGIMYLTKPGNRSPLRWQQSYPGLVLQGNSGGPTTHIWKAPGTVLPT